MAKLFTKDQFANALRTAPPAVRNAMQSSETVTVIEQIGKAYNLHIDTIDTLSSQIGYMLLGLLTPSDFYKNLQGLGIDPNDATSIVQEINTKIFLPLQKHMRDKAEEVEDEPEAEYDPSLDKASAVPVSTPSAPRVPVMNIGMSPAPSMPAPRPAPAVEPPAYNLIRPQMPAAPQPAPAASTAPIPAPVAVAPTMRTMQHDMAMVEQGHIADPYPVQRVAAPAALPQTSQMTPARAFQTASVPFTGMPTPPQPAPVPVPSQPIERAPQQAFQRDIGSSVAPVKTNSGDPYRESI